MVAAILLGLFPPDQFFFTTVRGGSPGACIAVNTEFFCSSWRGDQALMPASELRGWFADIDAPAVSKREGCTGHGCVPILKRMLAGYGVTPTEETLACAVVGCPDVLGADSKRLARDGLIFQLPGLHGVRALAWLGLGLVAAGALLWRPNLAAVAIWVGLLAIAAGRLETWMGGGVVAALVAAVPVALGLGRAHRLWVQFSTRGGKRTEPEHSLTSGQEIALFEIGRAVDKLAETGGIVALRAR